MGTERNSPSRLRATWPLAHGELPRRAPLRPSRGSLPVRWADQRGMLPRLCRADSAARAEARRRRHHGHVWTPPSEQEESSEELGAWSGADMCPASDAAFTCRRPVWEFAEQVQFNFARSGRVSMIWFSRSRLVDRRAILSVRPSHTLQFAQGASCPAVAGAR